MKNTSKTLAAAAIALLFLASCGTSGGLGDIFGRGNSGNYSNQIRGTVDSVDLNSGSVLLTNVSDANGSMLSSGGSSRNAVRVYFDNRTSVDYNGRSYRPQDLERGDQVSARVDQSSNRLYATSLQVLYDARTNGSYPSSGYPNNGYPNNGYPNNGYPNNGTNGSTIHGTVRSIDTYRRTMSVDTGYNSYTTVEFNANTPVYFNGRNYTAADLQTGDEIDIRVSDLGSGRLAANDITVTRSISNNNGTYGNNGSATTAGTIRGTVRSVDTYNHTIQLDSVTYTGFNRGSSTSTITVQYDPNLSINVQGQLYPVSGLERGDQIEVQADNLGGQNFFARQISLLRDVNTR
jgi:hypothetical protein